MKNFEKYEDEVRKFKDGNFCEEFVIPHILKSDSCAYLSCSDCGRRQMLWFVEEYEEPEVDWSQVEVDTPILVKYSELTNWKKRHFAKYENGIVYAWNNGETSWTTVAMTDWKYAKLAEDEKESEVDWNQVEIDTPILVKFKEDKEWVKRHFAKYENGLVYAWRDSCTSWTTEDMREWDYAKLAESEEPEVDWNKVEVDTPILVKYSEKGMWIRRKFAKFEDGVVYAWHGKETGHSKSYMTPWNYAKLAESERKDNISESNANNRR